MAKKSKHLIDMIEPGRTEWLQVIEDNKTLKQKAKLLGIRDIKIQLEELQSFKKDHDSQLELMWKRGDVLLRAKDALARVYIREVGFLRELHWVCQLDSKDNPHLRATGAVDKCNSELLKLTWTFEHSSFELEHYNYGEKNYHLISLRYDDGDVSLYCSNVESLWRFLQEWDIQADMSELEGTINRAKANLEAKQKVLDSFRKKKNNGIC